MAHSPNAALVERIFEEAIKGRTAAKIAESFSVDSSVVRAAMRDPEFKARVAVHRAEVIESGLAQLHTLTSTAIATLGRAMAGSIKGAGASASVKAAEAVLDRIGLTRARGAEAGDASEAERVVRVLVQVISEHPEVKEQAMRAIEAEVVSVKDSH